MAGVKADHNAYPIIVKNVIEKNLHQGILITEKSSAHVELNDINDNIKSNIAFGGKKSVNTMIIKNTIRNGRCEGIFIIDGGKSYINRNKIF